MNRDRPSVRGAPGRAGAPDSNGSTCYQRYVGHKLWLKAFAKRSSLEHFELSLAPTVRAESIYFNRLGVSHERKQRRKCRETGSLHTLCKRSPEWCQRRVRSAGAKARKEPAVGKPRALSRNRIRGISQGPVPYRHHPNFRFIIR